MPILTRIHILAFLCVAAAVRQALATMVMWA